MGFMLEDLDGFPWYSPAILLSDEEIDSIAHEVDRNPIEVKKWILAHERGHAFAFLKGENFKDELLAWEYAKLFNEIDLDFVKFALKTYGI